MEQHLLFAPLAAPQSRWKCFLAGWGTQAGLVAAALYLNFLLLCSIEQVKGYVVTSLVVPVPTTMRAEPVLHLRVRTTSAPILMEVWPAKLVVPLEVRRPKELQPAVNAPDLKLASSAPELPKISNAPAPLANVVATNTFATPTTMIPGIAKSAPDVQTGGFGDANGIPAKRDGKHGVNIGLKGSGNLPMSVGFGNGLGGSNGERGVAVAGAVIRSAGFDQLMAKRRKPEPEITNGAANPVEIIFKPRPRYTEEGRRLKIEGEVRLEVRFTAEGQVHVVKVLQGLGYGLDEQALHCAEQIKFKPAMHAGRAVDSTAVVHIIFELAS